jgi:hypothetical protein
MVDFVERVTVPSGGKLIAALLATLLAGPGPVRAESPRADDSFKIYVSWELNSGTPLETVVNEQFTLPQDCPGLVHSARVNGNNWLGNASHRELVGGLAFCRRLHLVGLGDPSPKYDFVSDDDFSSLSLELIPPLVLLRGFHSEWSYSSTERAIDQAQAACGHRSRCPRLSWAGVAATWHLPSRRQSEAVEEIDAETCHLRDGRFSGEVDLKDGTVRCAYDPETNGVKLYDVSFRDVDRDGTMDAILSITEVRDGGSAPYPNDEFVLTRRTPGGPLERVDVGKDEHRPWR